MYFPYIDRIAPHIDRPATPRSSPAGRGVVWPSLGSRLELERPRGHAAWTNI